MMMTLPHIAILGDYLPYVRSHNAVGTAIHASACHHGGNVRTSWVKTEQLNRDPRPVLSTYSGFWCVPCGRCKNPDGLVAAIQFARESGLPLLATGSACQLVMVEYLQNMLSGPEIPRLSALSVSRSVVPEQVRFKLNSRVHSIYGAAEAEERFCCRFDVEPAWEQHFTGSDFRFSARDLDGGARGIEHRRHPFFIATIFEPELNPAAGAGHPLVNAFVSAAGVKPH